MYTVTALKRLAETWVAAKGTSVFTLSEQACGRSNNRAIQRLIDGLGIGAWSAEKVSSFFDQHWPEDLAWPEGIARNRAAKVAAE